MTTSNDITIVGNVTKDPELRFTSGGQATASFGVAVNRRWQNKATNEWDEATSYFNVVCWRELAENAAETLGKGSRVIVSGRLEQRTWETQDGDKRSVIEVIADDIGPSLRWATAKVERNQRSGPEGGNSNNGGGRAGANSGGASSGGANSGGGTGASTPAANAPSEGYDSSEEPF